MAGTVTVTRKTDNDKNGKLFIEKISCACVADSADGSLPVAQIPMFGKLLRIVTNPGATAPTDNWDFILGDPDDNALDVLGGAAANRHTTTTQQLQPTVNSQPVFFDGVYALTITGNSVNSAILDVHFYIQQGE